MGTLNDILKEIADAIRKKGYNSTNGLPEIKASEFHNQVLLFAEYGFAENMVDENGKGARQINKIKIDTSITKINNDAFKGLNVAEIELHDNVESIGDSAFSNCSKLTSIDLKKVTTLGSNCFSLTRLTRIDIPASVIKLEGPNNSAFTQVNSIKYITVADGNSRYHSKDNNGKECNVCVRKEYTSGNTTYKSTLIVGCANSEIPEGVKVIFGDAMASNMCPKKLVLPSSIEQIVGRAFFNSTNLEELEVNSSISYSRYALSGIGTIKLIIPNLSVWLKSSFGGEGANPMASGVSGTPAAASSTLYVREGENVVLQEHIEIPEDITKIGKYSFSGCSSLKSVKFHSGITDIGDNAFYYCDKVSEYDCSELSTPPPTLGVSAFDGGHPSDWKIIIPSGSFITWKDATNWTNYKTYMRYPDGTNPNESN